MPPELSDLAKKRIHSKHKNPRFANRVVDRFTARDKLEAVAMVYMFGWKISEVCEQFEISRQTWYRWQTELRRAVAPIWGGLARYSGD